MEEAEASSPPGQYPEIDFEAIDGCEPPGPEAAMLAAAAVLKTMAAAGFDTAIPAEMSIRVVDNEESETLNRDFRDKSGPTNVLSFPGHNPEDLSKAFAWAKDGGPPVLLGDLVIAGDIVVREAGEQGKQVSAHYVHMVVHGLLHLLGFDHIEEEEARQMEGLETDILLSLGIADPWQVPAEMAHG